MSEDAAYFEKTLVVAVRVRAAKPLSWFTVDALRASMHTLLNELTPELDATMCTGVSVHDCPKPVAENSETDWPALVKELQDMVADRTNGEVVLGLLQRDGGSWGLAVCSRRPRHTF